MTLPFTPIAVTVKIAGTTSTQNVALPSNGATGESNCLVVNGSAAVAFVKIGKGVQTAVNPDSMPVPAGGQRVVAMPNGADNAAAILAAGTGDVFFCVGQGGSL